MLPEVERIEPVEVTFPVKVRVPEVEVTELPRSEAVAPATVRALLSMFKPLPPEPFMSRLLTMVMPAPEKFTVPPVFVEVTLYGKRVEPRVTS